MNQVKYGPAEYALIAALVATSALAIVAKNPKQGEDYKAAAQVTLASVPSAPAAAPKAVRKIVWDCPFRDGNRLVSPAACVQRIEM